MLLSKVREAVDRWFEELCIGLDDWFSGGGGMAWAGEALAGWRWERPLPTDRRLRDHVSLSQGMRTDWKGDAVVGESKSSNEKSCDFWAYCHMLGWPCAFCGGKNSLSTGTPDMAKLACPPKAPHRGGAWFGCCKTPSGAVKNIGWFDCCAKAQQGKPVKQDCGPFNSRCQNWPEAKNWCAGVGTYYCTIAVHFGSNDASCKDSEKKVNKLRRFIKRAGDLFFQDGFNIPRS